MKSRLNMEYYDWKIKVLKKCNYSCVRCGCKKLLHAHHIKSWSKETSLRYSVDNGEILCIRCHIEEHPYMTRYYKNIPRKLDTNNKTFGQILIDHRIKNKLTLEKIRELSGIQINKLKRFENNIDFPKINMITSLSNGYKIPIDYFNKIINERLIK